jgi:hypothetical protein
MTHFFGQIAVFLALLAVVLSLALVCAWLLYKTVEYLRAVMPRRHDYFEEYEELEDANRTQVLRRR